MNGFRALKNRAVLFRTIAHRDDVIEPLILELAHILRPLLADIDSNFLHGRDCLRMKTFRSCARAEDLISITRKVSQKSFRHLASSRVACTYKKDLVFFCYMCSLSGEKQPRIGRDWETREKASEIAALQQSRRRVGQEQS